jgi:HK97 family phage major capsid protein
MQAPSIAFSLKERRQYHLGAALLALADNESRGGLAWEISQDLEKALPQGARYRGGLLVPHSLPDVQMRAGLDTATSTKGPELVFQQPGPLIEALRKKAVVLRLGATELDGLVGNVKAPRLTGTATASWSTQNPGADVSDTNLLLDQASLTPRELIGTTSYSRQLLAVSQVSFGADKLVRGDLALSHAVAIDAGAIAGSGSSGQPTGIINTAGIGSVAGGTNGAQPTWANTTALESAVANANADPDPETLAYLTTPVLRNTLRNKDRTAGTSGWMILTDDNVINQYPLAVSNNVPSNLTKGTSVGEVVVDPFRLKKQGMIEVTTYELCDVTLRHPASFAAMLDALQ